jgi:fatty-acyl-CoA synthase
MRIARFKVPERIWFLDAFPVTQSANGEKIKRADLRAMAEARLAAEKEGAE